MTATADAAQRPEQPAHEGREGREGRAARRVLVVDDNALIRACLCDVLTDEGFEVVEAPNGEVALAVSEATPPHVVLLDMQMPVMDGRAFVRAYRARPGPHAPIVVMTAARDAAARAAQVSAAAIVPKPFEVDSLVQCVEQLAARFATGGA